MRIGKLFGIDIVVNLSWIFIFAFVAWALIDQGPFRTIAISPVQRITLGIITAILFFASVLSHELAHSLVARKRGIPIKRITLFIFGGVSSLEGEPNTAPVEAWIAFVGPLTSLVLGVVFIAISVLAGQTTPVGTATQYLGMANLLLGIFNLLPAYPLDGGRVLHALIWRWTKDRFRATRIASNVGRVMAIAFIGYGAFTALYSGAGMFNGLWLIFIGWFLLQAGGGERMQAELLHSLAGLQAKDIAVEPPQALPADITADVALQTMIKTGARALPVMLGDQLLGIMTMGDFAKLGDRPPAEAYVTSLMTRTEDLQSALPSASAVDVVTTLLRTGVGQVPVMTESGALVGFVTRQSVLQRMGQQRDDRRFPRAA